MTCNVTFTVAMVPYGSLMWSIWHDHDDDRTHFSLLKKIMLDEHSVLWMGTWTLFEKNEAFHGICMVTLIWDKNNWSVHLFCTFDHKTPFGLLGTAIQLVNWPFWTFDLVKVVTNNDKYMCTFKLWHWRLGFITLKPSNQLHNTTVSLCATDQLFLH